MTKFTVMGKDPKEEKKTVFTHAPDEDGVLVKPNSVDHPIDWDNIQLLKGKRDGLDQFLVWDNGVQYYHILYGIDEFK